MFFSYSQGLYFTEIHKVIHVLVEGRCAGKEWKRGIKKGETEGLGAEKYRGAVGGEGEESRVNAVYFIHV